MANKRVGILDGWWTDEFCLNRNKDAFTSVRLTYNYRPKQPRMI